MSPTAELHPLSGGAHLEALLANLAQLAAEAPDVRLIDGVDDVLVSGAEASRLSAREREELEVEVRRLCFLNEWFDVLTRSGAPAPYNYLRPFPDNAVKGPTDATSLAGRVDPKQRWNLLGREIGYPIGVPASVLTANRVWVRYFAQLGFNVLTFKTVRSSARPVQPFPNWVYLKDFETPISVDTDPATLVAHATRETYLRRLDAYSTANSFGVPSRDPDEWQPEIAAVAEELADSSKILIVSVMGMYEELSGADLVADFVDVALRAEAAGAHAIELNLSCPNSAADSGGPMLPPICADPRLVHEIVGEVRSRLHSGTPLIAKLSYLSPETLEDVVGGIAHNVQGVAGINTLQVRVQDDHGEPIFRKLVGDDERNRDFAGVSGIAIRDLAQHFVLSLHRLRSMHGWSFDIIGMGGVMGPHDVRALMALGAHAVQTATCASTNPRLPQQLLSSQQDMPESEGMVSRIRGALLDADAQLRSTEEIASELGLDLGQVEDELAATPDLPARISKLVWLSDLNSSSAEVRPTLSEEMWGAEPSEWETLEMEQSAQDARAAQWLSLVDGSSPLLAVSRRTGMDEDALTDLARDGRLLSFRHIGHQLFPDWQFAAGLSDPALQALAKLARAFAADLPEMHRWMMSPSPELAGMRPASVFAHGSFEEVLAAAETLAAAGR
jgi:dihydroorotate dehydrogenase